MLCISLSKSYLHFAVIQNGLIKNINKISLANKLDINPSAAGRFYNNLSAAFSILNQKSGFSSSNISVLIPSEWVDIDIYQVDPDLSKQEKQHFFSWNNNKRFGNNVTDFLFQYYPLNNSTNYLTIGYPKKLKDNFLQLSATYDFDIKHIGLDMFSVSNILGDLNVSSDYGIWKAHSNNSSQSFLFVKNNTIYNYLELALNNFSLDKIVKNANPISKKLFQVIDKLGVEPLGNNFLSDFYLFSPNINQDYYTDVYNSASHLQVPNFFDEIQGLRELFGRDESSFEQAQWLPLLSLILKYKKKGDSHG